MLLIQLCLFIGIIGLDNLEEKMKKNLKILMLQFAILIVGSGILDIMFDMNDGKIDGKFKSPI